MFPWPSLSGWQTTQRVQILVYQNVIGVLCAGKGGWSLLANDKRVLAAGSDPGGPDDGDTGGISPGPVVFPPVAWRQDGGIAMDRNSYPVIQSPGMTLLTASEVP